MTKQAKRAQVFQIALAAALGDREHVIGIPKGAPGVTWAEPPHGQHFFSEPAAAAAQLLAGGDGIEPAQGAHAAITHENLFAQIAWVGAEPPLVDAKG